MGEGADRVKQIIKAPANRPVKEVSGEIDTLRSELGDLVAELDRRRHEAMDLGLQMRRHPVAVAIAAGGVALVAGGLIAFAVHVRRERRRPVARARATRRALARLLEHPERVAREASPAQKIAAAVGTLVATTLAKRLLDRTLRPRPAAAHAGL